MLILEKKILPQELPGLEPATLFDHEAGTLTTELDHEVGTLTIELDHEAGTLTNELFPLPSWGEKYYKLKKKKKCNKNLEQRR